MIKQTQTKINKDDMMEDNKGDKNPSETDMQNRAGRKDIREKINIENKENYIIKGKRMYEGNYSNKDGSMRKVRINE